ncbi:MAG: chemotaxis protein CheW [Acidobacteriota bacterium]|nr:chemotaxis protein CheW [Acidobacteriota bacterium]
MIEPELLKTLERLEQEELLDVNPELPLPTPVEGENYLSILQELRDALGDPEEPFEEPETSFADSQNILELDAAQEIVTKAAEIESEFELVPEPARFDFSVEADSIFSDFDFKLPDEILPQEGEITEQFSDECSDSSDESEPSAVGFDFGVDSPVAGVGSGLNDFESSAEQPEISEEADSLHLENFLASEQFSCLAQVVENEEVDDLFSSEEENSAAESISSPEFPSEAAEEPDQKDFDFVSSVEETEFPEFLHEEEHSEEFSSEDFSSEETLAGETVSDFEPEDFEPETEDFSEFLPDAQRDFLNELDADPENLLLSDSEKSLEILPEPQLAEESAETNETRNPFVVFKLDSSHFAFPASTVAEIGHEPQVSALPFVPLWFSGITNLRGDVIAVLDLRGLWEMSAAAPDARRKMLVVHSEKENLTVGLLVDAVSEIRYFGESEINSAQDFSSQPFAFCVEGSSRMNENVLPILDVERFLASPKLRQF